MRTAITPHLKRAIFAEWTAILTLLLALSCLSYWGLSSLSHVADVRLAFSRSNGQIEFSAGDGTIKLSNDIIHHASLQCDELSLPLPSWDTPTEVHRLILPGFQFRRFGFAVNPTAWTAKVSILIPSALLFLISAICFWEHRRIVRAVVV
jgi:hypothetical protein